MTDSPDATPHPRQAARVYLERGWHPVVLKPASKEPAGGKGWQRRTYEPEDFRGDANVGVLLGAPSGHLVDVDLDVSEARELAGHLLGDLPGFGRASARGGHRIAVCTGAPQSIQRFQLPAAAGEFLGLEPGTDDKLVVLELRGNGQTMFPPSLHPSGERVEWVGGACPAEVPTLPYEELHRRVGVLAFLAVALRAYPRQRGSRNEVCMALAGALARVGIDVGEIDDLVTLVARLAGDEEHEERRNGAAALEKLEREEPVTGLTRLCELLGIEPLEKTLRGWLGMGGDRALQIEGAHDFVRDKSGNPVAKNQHNVRLAVHLLGARVRFDEFASRLLVEGVEGVGPMLNDAAMTRLWLLVEEHFGFLPGREFFWAVLEDAARREAFHPVRDYLDGLEWDGQPHIDTWLVRLAGAQDARYVRAVSRLFLIAAVRRVRQPGCKFDEMLIFESAQGLNKSRALKGLAVREEWFGEDLPLTADGKKVIEQTQGKWIIEAAELHGDLRKVDKLKAFLSTGRDRARLAYGRLPDDYPRHFVIIGTTNKARYLHDPTGNRRFWPVRVGEFDLEALRAQRDQLWAEAAHHEAKGESIRLDPALWEEAGQQQAEREAGDPWEEVLAANLGDREGKVLTEDVWRLVGKPTGQRTQADNLRLGEVMRRLGFEREEATRGRPAAMVLCARRV